MLNKGDTLTSKKNGEQYTINQVRRDERGQLLSYGALDMSGWFIVVYPKDMHRFDGGK